MATLTITADDGSKTYGDEVTFSGFEFDTDGLVNGDTVASVSLASDGAAATAGVGPYAIVASAALGSGLANYDITYVDGELTVGAKALTITADDGSKTYGDEVTFSGFEFDTDGLVNGDTVASVSLASDGAAATAGVGPYAIVASAALGSGLANYDITYVDGELTVGAKALTITADDGSKTYGDEVTFSGFEFDTDGLVNGDTVASVSLASDGAAATAGVGPYAIVASAALGSGLANYDITYVDGELTVGAKALTITADDGSKTYGDEVTFSGFEFDTDGLVNGDTVASVSLASDGAAATAGVGPYAIVASAALGSGLANYDITYVDGELTVGAKALTITADDGSKTYGDEVTFSGFEFDTDGLVNGDTVASVSLASDGAAATAGVGPYAIVASAALGSGLANYDITYVDGELTVGAKALTITADDGSKTYGDEVTFSGFEFDTDGLVNGDTVASVSLASDGAAATAGVGPYAIVASAALGSGLANYDITYVDGELTVGAKALTITADDGSKTYGDEVTFSGFEFDTDGLVNGDTVASVSLASDGAAATAGVGPYAIVASAALGSGLANYDITYVDGELTVGAKALTITADDGSKTYGDEVTFSGFEFDTDGLVNGDTVASVSLASDGAAATAGVGPYAIVASAALGSGLANYDITYVDGELTVGAKALTITADDGSKTYGDEVTFSGFEFDTDGLVNGDTVASVSLASDGAAATAGVGPYAIVASAALGSGLANYDITYVDGELTVGAKALTITADDGSKTYGDEVTFSGFEFDTDGLVNGDTVASVSLASDGAAATAGVGPYAIVASAALGSGLANYDITYVDGELTVGAKALTITADDGSKTYGDEVTFSGFEFDTDGLVNGDTVASVSLASDGAAATAGVGPYAIVASAALGSGLANYDITYVDGELTVGAKALTITADDGSKTYGDEVTFSGFEFDTDGLVNGDTVASVSLASDGAAATAGVGPYAIVASAALGSGLANYDITYVDGELTVGAKALTITADDGSKTYGDEVTFSGFEFDTDGLVNGDTVASVSLASDGAAATAGVGPYAIVASAALGSGLANYDITYVDGELTVGAKALTITADAKTRAQGAANPTFTVSYSGFVAGEGPANLGGTLSCTTTAISSSPPAGYPITCSGLTSTNYAITFVAGTLTVQPSASRILFSSMRDHLTMEIYSMNVDGTGIVRLTSNTAIDGGAVWSRDRTKIAFVSSRHGNLEIYTMNADGSNVIRRTVNSALDISPSWSPDGTRLVFASDRSPHGGNFEIYTMRVDGTGQGTEVFRRTNHAKTDMSPTWSPVSNAIAFTSERTGNSDIWTMTIAPTTNAIGTSLANRTNNARTDALPAWSPNGSRIAFSSDRSPHSGNFEIYSMTASGSDLKRHTSNSRLDTTPAYSSDGNRIWFSANRASLTNVDIYSMSASGAVEADVQRLTTHAGIDTLPD